MLSGVRWHLKLPASRLFAHPFVPAQIKGHIKAPRHWLLWGESIGDRWIPITNGSVTRKMFPFDDVIMYIFAFTGDLLERFPVCTESSLQRIWWYKTFQTRRGRWQQRSLALENKFHVVWILDAEMVFPHLIFSLHGKQWPVYLAYSSLHHGYWWFGDARYKRSDAIVRSSSFRIFQPHHQKE